MEWKVLTPSWAPVTSLTLRLEELWIQISVSIHMNREILVSNLGSNNSPFQFEGNTPISWQPFPHPAAVIRKPDRLVGPVRPGTAEQANNCQTWRLGHMVEPDGSRLDWILAWKTQKIPRSIIYVSTHPPWIQHLQHSYNSLHCFFLCSGDGLWVPWNQIDALKIDALKREKPSVCFFLWVSLQYRCRLESKRESR